MKNLIKMLTNNNKEIPLCFITFDLNRFKENGKEGSCDLKIHPILKGDGEVINKMNELVDYIRDNYDMEDLI